MNIYDQKCLYDFNDYRKNSFIRPNSFLAKISYDEYVSCLKNLESHF